MIPNARAVSAAEYVPSGYLLALNVSESTSLHVS